MEEIFAHLINEDIPDHMEEEFLIDRCGDVICIESEVPVCQVFPYQSSQLVTDHAVGGGSQKKRSEIAGQWRIGVIL